MYNFRIDVRGWSVDKTDQFDIYMPWKLNVIQCDRLWNEEKSNDKK